MLIAHQLVHHTPEDTGRDPDIAVNNPDDIAFGFTVSPADISDFGIGS